ncbi:HNH endonuclease [Sphingomonas sp. MG17]|uniref:HNH endonuclease n=1 Tax=Sphingomonas tagetis TaxID=2949092 RepID=A0A9X2HNW1_9SPHN|nr:HNH endonuclease signature motif containing protein [Sphingomonas tagetis]MCP3729270.1 HNH endonuclease [Sphingomonas tagetis]
MAVSAPVERKRGRAGQAQRLRRLKRTNGLCERCLGIGRWVGRSPKRTRAAARVNHIVPLIHGGSDEDDNTENLCRSCDIEVTAEQFGFDQADGRGRIDLAGRPTHPDHPWSGPRPGGGSKVGAPTPRTPRSAPMCTASIFKPKS